MSFSKSQKKVRTNIKYAVSEAFLNDNGKPEVWEFRPLTAREIDRMTNDCTTVKADGSESLDAFKLSAMMVARSVVYPDLRAAALQDEYGVKTDWELLLEMVDNMGELNACAAKIKTINGLDKTFTQEVEEIKN